MVNIAIFPIPNCVSFPGARVPLHVFEPRYRSMVKHCVETQTLMGVCHTQKVLRQSAENQSLEQALQANQALYKPCEVISAGPCTLLDTFEDGRMAIEVNMTGRYKILQEVQSLPFSLCECAAFPDSPATQEEKTQSDLTQEKIITRLLAMTANLPEIQQLLNDKLWQDKDSEAFSFDIFSLLKLSTDDLQQMLETPKAHIRLERLLSLLNSDIP